MVAEATEKRMAMTKSDSRKAITMRLTGTENENYRQQNWQGARRLMQILISELAHFTWVL